MEQLDRKMVQISKKTIEVIQETFDDKISDDEVASWINENIIKLCKKEMFLKRYAKHLEFMGYKDDKLILQDNHLNKVVGITLKDNRLWCDTDSNNGKPCMHKWFAMACLEIGLLKDSEK